MSCSSVPAAFRDGTNPLNPIRNVTLLRVVPKGLVHCGAPAATGYVVWILRLSTLWHLRGSSTGARYAVPVQLDEANGVRDRGKAPAVEPHLYQNLKGACGYWAELILVVAASRLLPRGRRAS